ncbi:MAG: prolyl oligopeptidase family serine peptidase [Verrucomicrobiota bacterium]
MRIHALIIALLLGSPAVFAADKAAPVWPREVRDLKYPCAADNSMQPALFYAPDSTTTKPLLVALHSWSGDYKQVSQAPMAAWCITNGWAFIHPNFRGPNNRPDAMGSELAVQDILEAVKFAKSATRVDERRVYLVGASGGGYASLLLAGRAPEIWAGVSAWVPITDLRAWYFESVRKKQKYAGDIVKSAGGIPEPGSKAEAECIKRSAITHLAKAKGVPLDINAGIHDGHTGSVPVSHTLNAFNLLAAPEHRLTAGQIAIFTDQAAVPEALRGERTDDPAYRNKPVLFRRQSGSTRVTLFEGGHEIVTEAALQWLAQQRRKSD